MVQMTRLQQYGKVDLVEYDWNYGRLNSEISKVVQEYLEEELSEDPPYITMPTLREEAHIDPLTIYVHLGIFAKTDGDVGPTWSFNLADLVRTTLEYSDEPAKAAKMRDALRALADSLS